MAFATMAGALKKALYLERNMWKPILGITGLLCVVGSIAEVGGNEKPKGPDVSVERIRALLRDPNAAVRAEAMLTLNAKPQLVRNFPDQIFAMANDPDPTVRQRSMESLGILYSANIQQEKIRAELLVRFKARDAKLRVAALRAALHHRVGLTAEATPVLVELIRTEPERRYDSLVLLNHTGPHAAVARPELLEAVRTGKPAELEVAIRVMLDHKIDMTPVLEILAQKAKGEVSMHQVELIARVFVQYDVAGLTPLMAKMLLAPGHGTATYLVLSDFFRQSPETALKSLVPLLRDENAKVRARAAMVLGNMDVNPKLFAPGRQEKILHTLAGSSNQLEKNLLEGMKDKNSDVRWFAAVTLMNTRLPSSADVVPLAVRWLQTDAPPRGSDFSDNANLGGRLMNVDVDRAAALVFDAIGTADNAAIKRFAEASSILPQAVLTSLVRKSLAKQEASYKQYGIAVLGALRFEAANEVRAEFAPELYATLKDQRSSLRMDAARLLVASQTTNLDPVVDVLIQLVETGEYSSTLDATRLLQDLGKRAVAAQPTFVKRLRDSDARIQFACANALFAIDRTNIELVLGFLKSRLQLNKSEEMDESLSLIARYGKAAAPLVPQLVSIVDNKKSDYRLAAAKIVLRIDPTRTKPAFAAITDILANPITGLQSDTPFIDVVRLLGPAAKPVYADLNKIAEKAARGRLRDDWLVTLAVIDSSEMNPAAKKLREVLTSNGPVDDDQRYELLQELEDTGRSASPYLPELIMLLQRKSNLPDVRVSVVRILREIGSEAKAALPVLLELERTVKNGRLKTEISNAIAAIAGN